MTLSLSRTPSASLTVIAVTGAALLACSSAADTDGPNTNMQTAGGSAGQSTGGTPDNTGGSGVGVAGNGGTPNVGGAGGAVSVAGTGGTSVAGAGGAEGGGGSGGVTQGGAGGAAGAATGGASGAGGQGTITVPRGMSAGCGQAPPGEDSSDDFVKHDIAVTGIDAAFAAEFPPNGDGNGGYTWEMRNYFVRLPAGYDPNTPYPVTFGGGGCGNTNGMSGGGGGQQAGNINSIRIGMSYVYNGGACFEDDHANTPEVPYFDAMMADIAANYCVNLEKVFMGGYSSGAWESYTLGLARGGVIRGIAAGAGGLRSERPTPSGIPVAAILLTGEGDGTNPIDGPTGSALGRDQYLMTNGCVGTETEPFTASPDDCVKYTGCPEAFPVIWCTPGGGHTGGSGEHWDAVGALWDSLPPVP